MATTTIALTATETIPELRAMGMSEATAHVARKRGYWCPGYNQRAYPQLDGPGGFADLYDPQSFVINHLAQALRKVGAHLDPETFRDWAQDLLLECWRRRHAPHVTKFVPYYQVMIRGLVRQWLRRRARQQEVVSWPAPAQRSPTSAGRKRRRIGAGRRPRNRPRCRSNPRGA